VAYPPDLNPIENLWHELKFYLQTRVKPKTKQELVDGIKKFWKEKVSAEKCNNYINHVLWKAIPAVVAEKGAAEHKKLKLSHSYSTSPITLVSCPKTGETHM